MNVCYIVLVNLFRSKLASLLISLDQKTISRVSGFFCESDEHFPYSQKMVVVITKPKKRKKKGMYDSSGEVGLSQRKRMW